MNETLRILDIFLTRFHIKLEHFHDYSFELFLKTLFSKKARKLKKNQTSIKMTKFIQGIPQHSQFFLDFFYFSLRYIYIFFKNTTKI